MLFVFILVTYLYVMFLFMFRYPWIINPLKLQMEFFQFIYGSFLFQLGIPIPLYITKESPTNNNNNNNNNKSKSPSTTTLLYVCNHVNLLDTFIINKFFTMYYPEYTIHYVYGSSAAGLPWISHHLETYHIPISPLKGLSIEEQRRLLSSKINEIRSFSSHSILVLFPEGKLYFSENRLHETNYRHVLTPREKGYHLFQSILSTLSPTEGQFLYDLTLGYPSKTRDSDHFMEFWKMCFWDPLPDYCHVIEKKYLLSSTSLLDIWKEKDDMLSTIYQSSSPSFSLEKKN